MPSQRRSRRFSSRSWSTAERFCFDKANSRSTLFLSCPAAQIPITRRNTNALWRSMRYCTVAIGRFLSVKRWEQQRRKQMSFTTAELALHYRGLGAGPPTSKVQKVKRLPSLLVQCVCQQCTGTAADHVRTGLRKGTACLNMGIS